jgi:hypothetical protein
MIKKVAVTFDLDFTDYLSNKVIEKDELESVWDTFTSICTKNPEFKSTWFIRIDNQIAQLYGEADYIFNKHKPKIDWLLANGHEIGWHFHSYIKRDVKWVQNEDEESVYKEMLSMQNIITKHDLKICRMGWAYHTNKTIKAIEELGFEMDFSALPRPIYHWDNPFRDWSTTTQKPFHPSKEDYRIDKIDNYSFWMIPINTFEIPCLGDTSPNVLRYLNPAYKKDIFKKVVDSIDETIINTVSHPYELLSNTLKHELMAFSSIDFEENLKYMKAKGFEFVVSTKLYNL